MTSPIASPAQSLPGIGPQVPPAKTSAETRAREAAKQFETMFVSQMLEHMSAGVKADGNFGGGAGETIQRSLLNEEYAKEIVKRGGIGIAGGIYREMLRMQETKP